MKKSYEFLTSGEADPLGGKFIKGENRKLDLSEELEKKYIDQGTLKPVKAENKPPKKAVKKE